jgi:hypothetical protein
MRENYCRNKKRGLSAFKKIKTSKHDKITWRFQRTKDYGKPTSKIRWALEIKMGKAYRRLDHR